jgi:hypothetical protein
VRILSDEESKDHHYVPVFLLSRFASATEPSMLQAYSWNSHKDELWQVPKAPRAVCYKPNLYTTRSHPVRPDALEKDLFGEIDTNASRLTQKLIDRMQITDDERERLLSFLFSLDARRPAIIAAARQYGPDRMAEMLNSDQDLARALTDNGINGLPSDFAVFDDAMSLPDRIALNLTEGLVRRPKYAKQIRSATWAVRHISTFDGVSPFALSDRPLVRVRGIHSNFVWALPLTPECVLVITALRQDMERIAQMSDKHLANSINSDSAMQCDRFVFWSGTGSTDWLARRLKARSLESRQSAEEIASRIGWAKPGGL